jgi:hypothetical protein
MVFARAPWGLAVRACKKEAIFMPTKRSRSRSSSSRKYGAKSSQKVKRAMHEMKRGKLKSGRSGKTVRNRKQAIAIGLSEARRAGGKVPSRRTGRSRSRSKSRSKRS